jgi:hypothetical protein
MSVSIADMTLLLAVPGAELRGARWEDKIVAHARLAKGTDFTPVLKGLPGDLCQCPHWGYVISGALQLRFADGRHEVVRAGEAWHAAPGHTAWCEEDTEFVDVSPADEFERVIEHVRAQLLAATAAAAAAARH